MIFFVNIFNQIAETFLLYLHTSWEWIWIAVVNNFAVQYS